MAATPPQLTRDQQWKFEDILFCTAWDPTRDRLSLGSSDFHIHQLDLAAEEPERQTCEDPHTSYVTGLALAGESLVSGSYDGQLIWREAETGAARKSVAAHDRWIRRVIATPDQTRVISVADDMRCKVWDAAEGELLLTLSGHAEQTPHHYPSMLYAVAVSADSRWLATGDRVGHVVIWDLNDGSQTATLEAPVMYTWDPKARRHSIGGIRSLAFSPDGSRLAVGGMGKVGNIDHLGGASRVEIFDWRTGERFAEWEDSEQKGLVEQLAWHPDQPWLFACGGDHKGFLRIYDLDNGEKLAQQISDGHTHGFVFRGSPDRIATAGHQRVETWTVTIETDEEASTES